MLPQPVTELSSAPPLFLFHATKHTSACEESVFYVFNWRKVPTAPRVDLNEAFEVHRGWSRPLTILPSCLLLAILSTCYQFALKRFSFHVDNLRSSSTTNLIQDTLLMHVNCQIRPELTASEGACPNNCIALQIIGAQIIAPLEALEAALGVSPLTCMFAAFGNGRMWYD